MNALLLLALLAQDAPVTVTRGANQPHLALDADGDAYVVFIQNGNIAISISTDKGKTFSAPAVAIDAGGKAKGGMQRGPRVAVDAKKTIYVTAPLCFDETEFKKQYPTQDLYLAVSTDGGKTFSKPRMINEVPKKAPESLHWLAAAPNGDVFVAWLDLRQREKGQDLAWAKITEQGKKISKNGLLPGPICECCAPGLAVDGKGNPVVVYREGGKGNRAIYLGVSTNGGGSFARVTPINQQGTRIDT